MVKIITNTLQLKITILIVASLFSHTLMGEVKGDARAVGKINHQSINVDSLVNELKQARGKEKLELLIQLSRVNINIDIDKSLFYEEKALELARDIGDVFEEVKSLGRIGQLKLQKGDHYSGMEYFQTALNLAKKNQFDVGRVNSIIGIAIAYTYMCRYDSSLKYYHEALDLSEELKYDLGVSISLNNIGIIYGNNQEYEKSYEFYQKALELYGIMGDSVRMANAYINLGLVHERNNEYKEALNYFEVALPIFKKYNEEGRVSSSFNSIGLAYEGLNKFEIAYNYYNKSLDLAKKINEKYIQSSVLINIGNYFRYKGLHNKAIQYYEDALSIAIEIDYKEEIRRSYIYLTNVYNQINDYKQAYKYLKLNKQIEDSIASDQMQKKLLEIETKYESEKKEKEIALLQAQNEIKDKQKVILFSILLGVFIMAALAIYIIIVKNTALKRKALLLQQENELDNLSMEKRELEAREKEAENLRLQEEMKSNEEIAYLRQEKLQEEIKSKNRELSTTTLLVVGKNGILTSIKDTIENLLEEKPKNYTKMLKEVVKEIDSSINADKDWDTFKKHFDAVHSGFFERLLEQFPDLTHNELRLCAYMRINLNTKEIAQMLNLSPTSVNQRRYRMRKKLNLDSDVSLVEYMINL